MNGEHVSFRKPRQSRAEDKITLGGKGDTCTLIYRVTGPPEIGTLDNSPGNH